MILKIDKKWLGETPTYKTVIEEILICEKPREQAGLSALLIVIFFVS